MGKTLQTRHEQMPETLDCRVDHWGRASCRVLMHVQALLCLICVCVWGGLPGPRVPPDCSLVFSACSACLKDMEILGSFLHGEKDFAGIRDVFMNDICIYCRCSGLHTIPVMVRDHIHRQERSIF